MNTFGNSVCTTKHECHLTEHKCYVIHDEETKSFIDGIYRYNYIFIDGTFERLHIECIDKEITKVPYLPNIKKHAPKTDKPYTISYKGLFERCDNLIDITVLEELELTNVTDLSYLFANCEALKNIQPLADWNVSKVENMSEMFYGCKKLENITTLSKWDVSNAKNMSYMFYSCEKIKDFMPISNWNVKLAERLDEMFTNTCISWDGKEVKKWRPRIHCNVYHFLDCQHDDVDNDVDLYKACQWIGICILFEHLGVTDIDNISEDVIYGEYIRGAIGNVGQDLRSWIDNDHKLDNIEKKPPLMKTAKYVMRNEPLYKQTTGYSGNILIRNSNITISEEILKQPSYYHIPNGRYIKITDRDGKTYELKEGTNDCRYIRK